MDRVERLLHLLELGVCGLSETHLRDVEVESIHVKNCTGAAKRRREVKSEIGGGVLVEANRLFKADLTVTLGQETEATEARSVILWFAASPEITTIVSRVYILPQLAPKLQFGHLMGLSGPCVNPRT